MRRSSVRTARKRSRSRRPRHGWRGKSLLSTASTTWRRGRSTGWASRVVWWSRWSSGTGPGTTSRSGGRMRLRTRIEALAVRLVGRDIVSRPGSRLPPRASLNRVSDGPRDFIGYHDSAVAQRPKAARRDFETAARTGDSLCSTQPASTRLAPRRWRSTKRRADSGPTGCGLRSGTSSSTTARRRDLRCRCQHEDRHDSVWAEPGTLDGRDRVGSAWTTPQPRVLVDEVCWMTGDVVDHLAMPPEALASLAGRVE